MSQPTRVIHDAAGLNSGTWPVAAPEHFITPLERFFTRSHAPVPTIDPATWRLEIDGLVHSPRQYSLAQLTREFPRHSVEATLVCAGLRREEFLTLGPLPGELPWGPEPVSNGTWSGVALRDVLQQANVDAGARYVEFTGLDNIEREGVQFGFGGSIDLAKAMDGDVLLATELNGVPLPPIHGSPLRAVVPGWIGARSVKWLGRVSLLAHPSRNYFQAKAYRTQRKIDPARPRDVSSGDALDEVPLNAIIGEPRASARVAAGTLTVRGWAMGSGSRPLVSVEVSLTGGNDWRKARIITPGAAWTWSLWEATVEIGPGPHLLTVRATDSSGATQPAELTESWNVKGYANNAWHRVAIIAS